MKNFILAVVAFVCLACLPALADNSASQVTIDEYAYTPAALTVVQGTKVTWTNKDDTPHTVVENDKKFRSSALDTGDSYSYVFDTPGTYHYFCTFHPKMVGTIVVTAK